MQQSVKVLIKMKTTSPTKHYTKVTKGGNCTQKAAYKVQTRFKKNDLLDSNKVTSRYKLILQKSLLIMQSGVLSSFLEEI